MGSPLRIAMWSGPRNISTAMLRAWGNRPDTAVCDEPFYAHYLEATGQDHPGREEIIACGETDSRKVAAWLTGEVPGGRAIFYQKHMTHHLLPETERGWMEAVTHAFLIRDPGEVIVSYLKKNHDPTVEDLGFAQQAKIFDQVCCRNPEPKPPIVDAADVLRSPEHMLRILCEALGTVFDPAMLRWPPGPRDTDGVWAKHWYAEVERSTAFASYHPKDEPVPARLRDVYKRCLEYYLRLHAQRLH